MHIPYEERKTVYEQAVATYGIECQVMVAVEEMAELTKELAKAYRPGGTSRAALINEIADVTIMMEQLRLIFDANEAVQDRIDYKVQRLAQRIKEEQHAE